MEDNTQVQQKKTLDLESLVLLNSFSETIIELMRSADSEQMTHLLWLTELRDKLAVKLQY